MAVKQDEIQEIIDAYDKLIRNIDTKASGSQDGRAYGGIIRAGKGSNCFDWSFKTIYLTS